MCAYIISQKKNLWNGIVAMALPNRREKNCSNWFVAMPLPKLRGKQNMWEWICSNGIAKIGLKKKMLQLVCGNGIAEIMERYKKKKYTYSYSFSIFFTETVWFVTFFYGKSTLWNRQGYFKYIDSYSKVHAVNKNKKKYTDSKHIRIDSSILILILKCTL